MTEEDKAKRARVTMKDVAAAAGVSQSTVSFVLNGLQGMRISRETRKRVLQAVDTLGYRHRGAGRPPKTEGPAVIGLMLDEIATSPFAAISIEGAQEEAWKAGLMVEVVMTRGNPERESAVLRHWAQNGVAGVIFGAILTREVSPPEALSRHRAVLLNCHDPDARFCSVVPAERRGGEVATAALISEGYRRIAFIAGEPWMEASSQRLEGYVRALETAGIAVDPALIVEGNFLPSGGRAATLALLRNGPRPDAIFCANDLTAVGCYEALKELGERVGQDIAVMGYDDQEIAQHLSPPLSTVLLPHREMGQWCVERLLSDAGPVSRMRIECPLILRQSHHKRQTFG